MINQRFVFFITALMIFMTLLASQAYAQTTQPSSQTITITREELRQMIHEEVKAQILALIKESQERSRPFSAMSTLQVLRSQLELYKLQHQDKYPTTEQMCPHFACLMGRTDVMGNAISTGSFGPYLQREPINPINECSTIVPIQKATARDGWAYDEKTGNIKLVLPKGSQYASAFKQADIIIVP